MDATNKDIKIPGKVRTQHPSYGTSLKYTNGTHSILKINWLLELSQVKKTQICLYFIKKNTNIIDTK